MTSDTDRHAHALLPLAASLAGRGRHREALALLDHLDQVAGEDGTPPLESTILRAKLLAQSGQYDAARALWTRVLEAAPEHSQAADAIDAIDTIRASSLRRARMTLLRVLPNAAPWALATVLLAILVVGVWRPLRRSQHDQRTELAALRSQVDTLNTDVTQRLDATRRRLDSSLRSTETRLATQLTTVADDLSERTDALETHTRDGLAETARTTAVELAESAAKLTAEMERVDARMRAAMDTHNNVLVARFDALRKRLDEATSAQQTQDTAAAQAAKERDALVASLQRVDEAVKAWTAQSARLEELARNQQQQIAALSTQIRSVSARPATAPETTEAVRRLTAQLERCATDNKTLRQQLDLAARDVGKLTTRLEVVLSDRRDTQARMRELETRLDTITGLGALGFDYIGNTPGEDGDAPADRDRERRDGDGPGRQE